MSNVFDYLAWRGDLSFTQDPPNAVDALIFSALAYVRFGEEAFQGTSLREAAAEFLLRENPTSLVRVKKDLDLLRAAAETRRFGLCGVCFCRDRYLPEEETQFAAVTFLLDDGSAFLAFRGTDETLIGWKEDFNMSFRQTIPSQLLAQEYVREFSAEYLLPMRLGGHSKGGNLAVFAAARSSPMVQKRILQVYNNDGPGFTEYLLGDPGYLAMVPRIRTFVPQSSVIGMLLEHEEPYTVIKSSQVSLMQHEIYSWEVVGKSFVPMEEITADSRFLNLTIKNWISQMTPQERGALVDGLFSLLSSGEVKTAVDIFQPKNIRHYLRTINENSQIRRAFSGELRNLAEAARDARSQFSEKKPPEDKAE